jgi:hypothetical protein
MELLCFVDLIILGWECQGFLTTGFGEGLNDTKSTLFTDMLRLIMTHPKLFDGLNCESKGENNEKKKEFLNNHLISFPFIQPKMKGKQVE